VETLGLALKSQKISDEIFKIENVVLASAKNN
jgi:hypothetical protein